MTHHCSKRVGVQSSICHCSLCIANSLRGSDEGVTVVYQHQLTTGAAGCGVYGREMCDLWNSLTPDEQRQERERMDYLASGAAALVYTDAHRVEHRNKRR